MNYIRHLNAFFSFVRTDNKLTSAHVSLYMAMFQYWNLNRFQNPFAVYRNDMMLMSKIGSKNTYHKCMKDLHSAGYIFQHLPASKYIPIKISMVRLDFKTEEKSYQQLDLFGGDNPKNTSPKNETQHVPNMTATSTDFDTVPVPNMGHLLKPNSKHLKRESNTPTHVFDKNKNLQDGINQIAVSSTQPNNQSAGVPNSVHIPPTLAEVEDFFQSNNFPAEEALKFFHHYQSNGWKIAGKTPMQNWQSSIIKWMLNAKGFTQQPPPNPHSLNTDKDYSEPL